MDKSIDANVVDAIEISATTTSGRVRVKAKAAPDAGVLEGFLTLFSDKDFDLITSGTRAQKGFDLDYVSVAYEGDQAYVSATDNTLIVPSAAFDRLVARLSRAVIDAAAENSAGVTRELWWSKAQDDAETIITRAYPKGL